MPDGESMEEQHQHRAKPLGYAQSWVFLPAIALIVGLIFALTITVIHLLGAANVDLAFWWAFVWLVPVLIGGRYAVMFLERRLHDESTLGPILNYMKQAQKVRPNFEIRVEKITNWAVYGILGIAFIASVLGWAIGGLSPQSAVERFMTVLLIAAPQALWLALPSVSRL
ncbi:MAG: hypothetical protein ACKOUD_01245, partial [Rhodoluna sp.]